ncbi:MAG: hypothetical protein NTY12_02815 [Candidatus Falkowbacteria bacterium]|nr:hypothetical protein [Candidatus Falkowbacteria bacterium]
MIAPSPRHRLYNTAAGARRRGNPYFANKKKDNFGASVMKNTLAHISPRVWLWFFLFIIVFIFLAWLLLFSNVLVVKNIEVKGTNLISSSDVETLASDHLDRSRLLFLSESRLAVFDSNSLKQEINDRYALDNIKVVKKIPSTLQVIISEKAPAAVWFEADTYQQIDASGWILVPVAGPVENLPIIFNNGFPKINDKKIDGADKIIVFAKNLTPEFVNRFSGIKIKQLAVDNEQDTIKLVPERGAMIYFSTSDDLNKQLDRLDLLLRSELKDRFEKVRNIDLRFGDKVYYQ